LIVFWLWQWGHSMAFSLALLLFSHDTNLLTSADFDTSSKTRNFYDRYNLHFINVICEKGDRHLLKKFLKSNYTSLKI
jgi:hypothetical protein